MYDQHASAAGVLQDLVHAWGHLFGPTYGVQAMMRVPHVTDNDGCLARAPLLGLLAHSVSAIGHLLPETFADRDQSCTTRLRMNKIEDDRYGGRTSCRTEDSP